MGDYGQGRGGDHMRGGDHRDRGDWRSQGSEYGRGNEGRHEGSGRPGGGNDDRGFLERAGDELRSWAGDEEAQRRREMDARRQERERGMTGRRDNEYGGHGRDDRERYESRGRYEERGRDHDHDHGPGTLGGGGFGGGWGNQAAESWNRERPGRPGWFTDSVGGERGHRRGGESGRESGWFGGGGEGERYERGGGSERGPSGYGAGGPGIGGGGFDTPTEYGRRFDRVDAGSTGSHGAHPMSSPVGGTYGTSTSTGREAEILRQAQHHGGRGDHAHDPHYAEWRRRQIEDLDRDYEEYRREHQSKFDSEFAGWRTQRQGRRQLLNRVTEHMEVVGSDGTHLGTVDKVDGDRIVLTRSDPAAGGVHHSIPCSWVETVEGKVTLNRTAEDARSDWRSEERSRALFERPDSGSEGPHMLERSFSGTYPDERKESAGRSRDEEQGGLGDANPTDRTGRADRIDPKP